MNLIAFCLPLFATLCIASDSSNSSNSSAREQSAYDVGCELAKVKDILATKSKGKGITMRVNIKKLKKNVKADWKENIALSVALPKVFDMNLLKAKLKLKKTKKIELKEFRLCLLECALNDEASVVTDVAILKWIVQTIDNNKQMVEFDSYDVKVVCALSLTPTNLGTDYYTDITKVLGAIPKFLPSLKPAKVNDIVYTLVALLKHLQSPQILAKLEQVMDKMLPMEVRRIFFGVPVPAPLHEEFGFFCLMVLGSEHSLIAKLAKNVPEEQFKTWITQYQQLSSDNEFRVYFLGSRTALFDEELLGLWNSNNPVATIGLGGTLEWDSTLSAQLITHQAGQNEYLSLNESHSFLSIYSTMDIPDFIWKGFKSCASLEQVKAQLKRPETVRSLLFHEFSVWETNFKPVRTSGEEQ